jgi:hypothetical protein
MFVVAVLNVCFSLWASRFVPFVFLLERSVPSVARERSEAMT